MGHSHPVQPRLHAWLQADGSLTARLRQHGVVQVVVVRQGTQALWPQEQQDLGCRSGHVREVVLLVDGMPAVWARSATPHAALQGPWKALANLGNRPLAELLFQGRRVQRSPLQSIPLVRHGLMDSRLHKAWTGPLPRWARSSVFWHQGQPLRVMEAFAPWLGLHLP